jgi:hypothetical protein
MLATSSYVCCTLRLGHSKCEFCRPRTAGVGRITSVVRTSNDDQSGRSRTADAAVFFSYDEGRCFSATYTATRTDLKGFSQTRPGHEFLRIEPPGPGPQWMGEGTDIPNRLALHRRS